MSNQTLEEIANSLFDEMGFKEGDETTFDKGAFMANGEAIKAKSHGEQEKEENSESSEPVKKEQKEERLYAGKFKTVEEMEAAFLERKEEPPQPKKPAEEELPDLTKEELISLHEQDDMDGKSFTAEYLQKKMQTRNLEPFEVEKLKELDVKGEDLYGKYVSLKTKREVMEELRPTLEPIQQKQSKEQYDSFIEREKAVLNSLDTEYEKTELATLRQKTSDPKFVSEVLSNSDMGRIIQNEFQNGSKALAYKMLIRETKQYLSNKDTEQKQKKAEKSFPADVGSTGAAQKKTSAMSIEEAFNDSLQEFNL